MKIKKLFVSFFLLGSLLAGCNFTSSESSDRSSDQNIVSSSETAVTEESSVNLPTTSESETDVDLDKYFVAFWLDHLSGDPYVEYEVTAGTPVTFPHEPLRDDFTFVGWYLDGSQTAFVEGTPVYDDLDLYAKWQSDLGSDGLFQIVGDLQNSNLSAVTWDGADPSSFLNNSEPGFYELTLELGYGAEFKIRETNMGWDGIVLDYNSINEGDRSSYISESGEFGGNVRINSAGTYFIEAAPSDGYLYIEIISTSVSAGVTVEETPAISGLRLIGDLNDENSLITWDITPFDESALFVLDGDAIYTKEVYINEGGQFKIKEPNVDWNEGLEVNYGNIWTTDRRGFMSVGEHSNIVINESATYLLTVTVNRAIPRLVITKS